jgi:hypothetical protein
MKKEFAQLVKDMRVAFHPEFSGIANNSTLTTDQFDKALSELEEKQKMMIVESGYTQNEFDTLCREHFMDFSSQNPEEWIIRHDPENALIIINH